MNVWLDDLDGFGLVQMPRAFIINTDVHTNFINLLYPPDSFNPHGIPGTGRRDIEIDLGGAVTDYVEFEIQDWWGYWTMIGEVEFSGTTLVPVPAAAWLFGSGLLGLIGVAKKRKAI